MEIAILEDCNSWEHACMHACVRACMHACMHAYTYAFIHAYMHGGRLRVLSLVSDPEAKLETVRESFEFSFRSGN